MSVTPTTTTPEVRRGRSKRKCSHELSMGDEDGAICCKICLIDLLEIQDAWVTKGRIVVALGCGHVFCSSCTRSLQKCPVCRSTILSKQRIFFPWLVGCSSWAAWQCFCARAHAPLAHQWLVYVIHSWKIAIKFQTFKLYFNNWLYKCIISGSKLNDHICNTY